MARKTKYYISCSISPGKYMKWAEGELLKVDVLRHFKLRGRKGTYSKTQSHLVPAPYAFLVSQLLGEVKFGEILNMHEARRRQAYAARVLDLFGEELWEYTLDATSFRSRVLTPILQRQLWGVHDAYLPSIQAAIAGGEDREPTMAEVVRFYLEDDPVSPGYIATYRRNMLYIPEPRWHLGTILGKSKAPERYYRQTLLDHDKIMEAVRNEEAPKLSPAGIPVLRHTEVKVIAKAQLSGWFIEELQLVVGDLELPAYRF